MSEIKSVNIPVGKFSVAKALEIIQKHANGRVLHGVYFNATSLMRGTLEIHTSPIPTPMPEKQEGPSKMDLLVAARKKRTGKTSKYIGVYWDKESQKWRAQLMANKKPYIKRFKTEKAAARQYDAWAREHHGKKAILNFPNHIEHSPEANENIDNIIQKLSDSNEGT